MPITHTPTGDELGQTEYEADPHVLSALVISELPFGAGAANRLLGMDAAASAGEWKNIVGTSNRITVTHSAGGITLNGPQDLHTAAAPTFAGVIGAYLKPATDSTTALQLQNAAGAAVLTLDTTNSIATLAKGNAAVIPVFYLNYHSSSYVDRAGALIISKSHHDTLGTIGATQSGEMLGGIQFRGVNAHPSTPDFANAAIIMAEQDGAGGTVRIPGRLVFYTGTNAASPAERMRIDNTGQMGLGITSMSAQFHTSGTVRFQNFGAGTATFDASGNVSSVSDIRFKDVLANFTGGLPEIMRITPIVYRWNKESGMETEHEYAGFSAQNVEQAIPLAVGRNPEGYLSLQDRALMAAMVNAIKSLKAEIDQLKGAN